MIVHRRPSAADQEARHVLDRLSGWPTGPPRCRRSPQSAPAARATAPGARRACRGHRVDLVDDHVRTRASRARRRRASRMYSDSGVVTRMCGGGGACAALARRRVAGAHRVADLDVRQPQRAQPRADAGERLLQVALDVVRQRLQRRDVDDRAPRRPSRPCSPCRTRSSIAARKAASVLPDPVGAAIRTCLPPLIARHASACAAVATAKALSNQAAATDETARQRSRHQNQLGKQQTVKAPLPTVPPRILRARGSQLQRLSGNVGPRNCCRF